MFKHAFFVDPRSERDALLDGVAVFDPDDKRLALADRGVKGLAAEVERDGLAREGFYVRARFTVQSVFRSIRVSAPFSSS